jgi:malonate-semialdehyde dehydrogenase (acetylating)/methylmalonate-semialdehyde dehydrogenase
MTIIDHYIDHALVRDAARTSPVFNPATGEIIAEAGLASPTTIDLAVSSARAAAASWATSSLSSRTQILFAFRHLLATHSDELAALITREHGKTLADARGEIARGLENVEYACGLADHLKGEFSPQVSDGVDVHSFRSAVGVVAAITPFNFPAMVPLWMIANAVATGNCVVLKPSERDPSTAVRLAQLWADAGLPAGVLNVIHGDASAVNALLAHPGIDAVSFVGSTPVAQHIYREGTLNNKRVQALGGAKNHMLVLPDADLDLAADAAVSAGYGAAGERCMAISVVVAVDAIADELVAKIAERIDRLRVGDGSDTTSDFGPLITEAHRDRVAGYVTRAGAAGATVVRHGDQERSRPGFFYGAALLDHVNPDMECYRDEIFGPVLCVVRVASYDDGVTIINANPFGNGVALFTRDGNAARHFSRHVSVGMIGVNVSIPVPVASYSFGGWKDSLFGHAHMYGPEGITFFTRNKVVTSRWPVPSTSQLNLGFPTTR